MSLLRVGTYKAAKAGQRVGCVQARESQSLFECSKRHHSLYFTKLGMDLAKARLWMQPHTKLAGGGDWIYWSIQKWIWIGNAVFVSFPFFWCYPYLGDFSRWITYHTLSLYPDSYNDPLIPPPVVWGEQHNHFIKQLEIRKDRLRKQQQREKDFGFKMNDKVTDKMIHDRQQQIEQTMPEMRKVVKFD